MKPLTAPAAWIVHGVYAFRTAQSVARQLRSHGWQAKVTKDQYANATVWKRRQT